MKTYQKQWLETAHDFIGLWDRFDTLYLQGILLEEVTEEREDEFLQFEGTMVEQLVKVGEVERGRFSLHDLVMAVVHEALSLRHLARQSDFQRRRLRQHWTEAADALSKLYRFCETYTPKVEKTTRLEEVRRLNPFWDPAGGGFQATLTKIAVGPATFFSGLRPGRDEKSGWFLFKIVIIPSLLVFLVLAISHLSTVQQMAYNFTLETGLLDTNEGFVPKLMIHVFALLGVALLALVTSAVLMVLSVLHAGTLHVAFKLFGGKQDFQMSRKITVYGGAPVVAIVTAPYAIVLQMIGAAKTQKLPPVLAVLAWLVGTALLAALVLGVMFVAYHFTGQIPEGGRYVEVTAVGATTYKIPLGDAPIRPGEQIASGRRLDYRGETQKKLRNTTESFYRVVVDGKETLVRQEDCTVGEFRRAQLIRYMLDLTRKKVLLVVERLSREIGAEAD